MKRTLCLLLILALLPLLGVAEQKPIIQTTRLVDGMQGVHYGLRILAEGEQPMLFHQASADGPAGDLPPGLKLSESGILTGTPTAEGTYAFTVRVTNPAGSSYMQYALRIHPFDEEMLRAGGEDTALLGEGQDSLDGIANAINGGRITRQGDTVYFTDAKGFLYEQAAPFDKKPRKLFSARQYGYIDSNPDTLYYYQRYLDNEATKQRGVSTYVTRIAEDPIVGKGRNTLLSLTWEDFSSLSITGEALLYIGHDQVMGLVAFANRAARDLRMYAAGQQVKADLAIPYNGRVYFREPGTGHLYRAWLDGELAQPLVQQGVLCYTIGRLGGEDRLIYALEDHSLHAAALDGSDAQPVGEYKASALNASEQALFFADADNKHRLTMLAFDNPEEPTVLSEVAVDQIYTLQDAVAYRRRKEKDLFLLQLGSEDRPVRLIK